jgi:prevent-host-death family protein
MPIIKPVSDLRNHFKEIADLCHEDKEPIFITKNGQGEFVVMSMSFYEKQQAQLDLYQKLQEAEEEAQTTGARYTHQNVMTALKKRANDKV